MARKLMKGNEAIGEAAIQAGCRLFFAYPITPQSEVAEYLSRRMLEAGGNFVQAESELAASNMVFGAAATGEMVFTTSSSPGISLMCEAISYIAGAQLPAVFVNIVRGGPGLIIGQWGDRNLAYDPDVLGHELFHVVHSRIAPEDGEVESEIDSLGFNTTPMAVAEAAADYFSCSLSGDADVGEYSAGALDLPFLSSLENDRRFPWGRTGQSHADALGVFA